jgi:hypothetical protein
LGYYFGKSLRSPEASKAQQEIVLWFIENHPASPVCAAPQAHIHDVINPEGYAEAKRLWLEKVKAHGRDAKILGKRRRVFHAQR